MPKYQRKYDRGEQLMIEQKYLTIIDVDDENDEYLMSWKGRLRWKDVREIDAISEPVST
jgi:hypothetical protein